MRGSNVDKKVNKFMVLPEEREGQLIKKMTSPLFKDHFENENWQLIYFDALRNAYTRGKAKTDIYSLANKKRVSLKSKGGGSIQIQGRLF